MKNFSFQEELIPLKIEATRFRSGQVIHSGRGYTYTSDNDRGMFMGVNVKHHYRTIKSRFIWIASIILFFEILLLVWPITATAVWKLQAVINWIWFVYALKCILLIWAIFSSGTMAFEKLWGTGSYNFKQFYRLYGTFRPSSSLFGWSTISFLCGVVLGTMGIVISASLYKFYDSTTLYILTLCIGFVCVMESFVSPFILYTYGLSSPVVTAKAKQLKKNDLSMMNKRLV